jgi:hypothetical protein
MNLVRLCAGPRLRIFAALLLLFVVATGCNTKWVWPWQRGPVEEAPPPPLVELEADQLDIALAEATNLTPAERVMYEKLSKLSKIFYDRLTHRRVNSISTYHDPALREFFTSDEDFADYYADLVQSLDNWYFEAIRPTSIQIRTYAVEQSRDRVRILVRFRGENSLPLRWWGTEMWREDMWQYTDERWFILPGKV